MPDQPNDGHNTNPAPSPVPENIIPITFGAPSGGGTGTPAPSGFTSGTPPPGPPAMPNRVLRTILLNLVGQAEERIKQLQSNDDLSNSLIEFFYQNTKDNRLGRIMDQLGNAVADDQEKVLRLKEILEHMRNFALKIQ